MRSFVFALLSVKLSGEKCFDMTFSNKYGGSDMRLRIGLLCLFVLCLGFSSNAAAQPSVVGRWSRVPDLPFFPVHTHVLPTGKVMIWPGDLSGAGGGGAGNDVRLWDPVTATTSFLTPPGYDVFCSGHAFLADGRLFVAGGHIQNEYRVCRMRALTIRSLIFGPALLI